MANGCWVQRLSWWLSCSKHWLFLLRYGFGSQHQHGSSQPSVSSSSRGSDTPSGLLRHCMHMAFLNAYRPNTGKRRNESEYTTGKTPQSYNHLTNVQLFSCRSSSVVDLFFTYHANKAFYIQGNKKAKTTTIKTEQNKTKNKQLMFCSPEFEFQPGLILETCILLNCHRNKQKQIMTKEKVRKINGQNMNEALDQSQCQDARG